MMMMKMMEDDSDYEDDNGFVCKNRKNRTLRKIHQGWPWPSDDSDDGAADSFG